MTAKETMSVCWIQHTHFEVYTEPIYIVHNNLQQNHNILKGDCGALTIM